MEYELNTFIRKRRKSDGSLAAAITQQTIDGKLLCDLCSRPIQDPCLAAEDHSTPVRIFVERVTSGLLTKEEARAQCNAQENLHATHRECNDSKNGQSRAAFMLGALPKIRAYTENELSEIRELGHRRWQQRNQSLDFSDQAVCDFVEQLAKPESRAWFYVRSSKPEPFIAKYAELTNSALALNVVSPRGKQSTEVNIHFADSILVPTMLQQHVHHAGAINRVWLFWELVRLGFRVGEQASATVVRENIRKRLAE